MTISLGGNSDSDSANFFSSQTARELLLGALSGVCSGMICSRFGKLLAASMAGGIFLIHLMEQRGLLTFNWDQLTEAYRSTKQELKDSDTKIFSQAKKFVVTYKYFFTGLSGGFVVGILLN